MEDKIGIKVNQELTQSWLDEVHFEIPPAPLLEHSFIRTCCSHAEPVIVFTNEDKTEFEEISDDLIILEGMGYQKFHKMTDQFRIRMLVNLVKAPIMARDFTVK